MHRFLIRDGDIILDDCIQIFNKDNLAHFAARRIAEGEIIEIIDPDSRKIVRAKMGENTRGSKNINLQILNIRKCKERSIKIHLFQMLTKSAKMDIIVQKAVELGVLSITPCISKNSEKHGYKHNRLKKIADEASLQSMQEHLCKINEPISLNEALEISHSQKIFFYENAQTPLKQIISGSDYKEIAIYIGSEGGFTEEEVMLASKHASIASLGSQTLRAETAAICAISNINYEL